jgi:hypothetical protein
VNITRLCACGCGAPIPLAKITRPADGLVKGQQSPARFLRGHNRRVTRPPGWKGEDAGYRAIHIYLNAHFPKTGTCEECGVSGKTDYALIKGRAYSRDRADYRELCKRCHNRYDGIGRGHARHQRAVMQPEKEDVHVRIDEDVMTAVRVYAATQRITLAAAIEALLHQALNGGQS